MSASSGKGLRRFVRMAAVAGVVASLLFPLHAQVASPFGQSPWPNNDTSSQQNQNVSPGTAGTQPSGSVNDQRLQQQGQYQQQQQTQFGQQTGETQRNQYGQRIPTRGPLPPDRVTAFQQLVLVSTGQQLPIFGSSLFREPPSTFAPVDNIPVTPDYVIGPGDELRIQVWGQVNQQGTFTVDRTGAIAIPQLGTVHVAGLRFADITAFLRGQLSRVYRNFNVNVNMGQLRTIQIFVVGQARQPGSYIIGSLSTLVNALFASGGPTPQGSLRDIQLRRGNQTVVHFDLYDLLLRGDKSSDVPLLPGDVIFIPPVGPEVALAGAVNNPAIYELRGETTPEQVLTLTGGRSNVAAGSTIRVERIVDRQARTVEQVDLKSGTGKPLEDGDIITVNPLADRFREAITLRGNVANPGRYRWRAGMHITDLLPDRDALVTRNYWLKRSELGQPTLDFLPALPTTFNQANQTGNNLQNNPYQNQQGNNTAYPNNGYNNGYSGSSNNPQNQPGPYNNQNTTNPNQQNYPTNNPQPDGTYPQNNIDPTQANQRPQGGYMQGNNQQPYNNPASRNGSSSSSGGGGAVAAAALAGSDTTFPVRNDVILSAPDIDWSYAVIERQDPDTLRTSLVPFNLGRAVLNGDASQNPALQANDVVTIFSTADIHVPSSQQTRFVRLEGEFASAGVYSVAPGETLRQLVARAGGLTSDAYLYASEFTRQSTRRVEQQRLIDYANQLDAQVSAQTSSSSARAITDRDAAAAEASAAEARAAVARLRQLQPIGRIVLQLKPDSQGVDAIPDLPLEDGDRFIVPKTPSNIYVEGEVYSANAFVFERGQKTSRYLRLAGGPNRQADRRRGFVLRADGSVFSRQYGNWEKATIFPGDTIVLPPVINKRAILRDLVDISNIVGGFGVGIAAINVLR